MRIKMHLLGLHAEGELDGFFDPNRYFCDWCFRGFVRKNSFWNHNCEETEI